MRNFDEDSKKKNKQNEIHDFENKNFLRARPKGLSLRRRDKFFISELERRLRSVQEIEHEIKNRQENDKYKLRKQKRKKQS